jgi:hypothetical protein
MISPSGRYSDEDIAGFERQRHQAVEQYRKQFGEILSD